MEVLDVAGLDAYVVILDDAALAGVEDAVLIDGVSEVDFDLFGAQDKRECKQE
jgi:hypothetical protein